MTKSMILFFAVSFSLILSHQNAFAWGARGHHTLCEAAVFLVKDAELKEYLSSRGAMMGHLCNTPDIYWRGLAPEQTKLGNPTHYMDMEILGLSINAIPLDFQKIVADYTGKKKANKDSVIRSVPTDFGSMWWRADQFFRRAVNLKSEFEIAKIPQGSKEEQDEALPFNKAVSTWTESIGVMGHFVGDASQPFHNTDNYDGYEEGHGGIHSYYEERVVSATGPELLQNIVKSAKAEKKNAAYLTLPTTLEKMRALSVLSAADIKEVLKADLLTKKSEMKSEKGMNIKTPAERADMKKTLPAFEKLVVKHMGRSAVLLAKLWDEAYEGAGKPQLTKYRSFKYPLTPEFVAPDYAQEPTKSDKTTEAKKN